MQRDRVAQRPPHLEEPFGRKDFGICGILTPWSRSRSFLVLASSWRGYLHCEVPSWPHLAGSLPPPPACSGPLQQHTDDFWGVCVGEGGATPQCHYGAGLWLPGGHICLSGQQLPEALPRDSSTHLPCFHSGAMPTFQLVVGGPTQSPSLSSETKVTRAHGNQLPSWKTRQRGTHEAGGARRQMVAKGKEAELGAFHTLAAAKGSQQPVGLNSCPAVTSAGKLEQWHLGRLSPRAMPAAPQSRASPQNCKQHSSGIRAGHLQRLCQLLHKAVGHLRKGISSTTAASGQGTSGGHAGPN